MQYIRDPVRLTVVDFGLASGTVLPVPIYQHLVAHLQKLQAHPQTMQIVHLVIEIAISIHAPLAGSDSKNK